MVSKQLVCGVVETCRDRAGGATGAERVGGEHLQQGVAGRRRLVAEDTALPGHCNHFAADLESIALVVQSSASPDRGNPWKRVARVAQFPAHVVETQFETDTGRQLD